MKKLLNFSLLFVVFFVLPTTNHQLMTIYGQTPEEQAIYNLNQGLLPKEVIKEKPSEDQNILQKILSALSNLVSPLLFIFQPQNPPKVYSQSESIQQAEVPIELKPQDENPVDRLKEFLGGSLGFYGVSLPDISGINKEGIQESERLYEKANFPEGIRPVTGQ